MNGVRHIDVIAGVLRHPDDPDQVLLAQRPAHKVRGGLWEFPGGKIEPGEAPAHALGRELSEELGIVALATTPLFKLCHRYPDLTVHLHVQAVHAWTGDPQPLDAQALHWQSLAAPDGLWPVLSHADRRLRRWLRLPACLSISPDCPPGGQTEWLAQAQSAAPAGLLLVRTPSLERRAIRDLCLALLAQRPTLRDRLLLSGEVDLARELDLGIQLKSAQLQDAPAWNVSERWRGASCHDARELFRAAELGCDYATLGPVKHTLSHPDAAPLGWDQFATLAANAELPVFALGGLHPSALAQARHSGGHGVAGIRGFWPTMQHT